MTSTCSVRRLADPMAFDKKNAKWFGDQIFSETKEGLKFIRLCCEALQDPDAPKMHCAVGEAYATFVKPNLRSVLSLDKKTGQERYSSQWVPGLDGSTAAAIDALVEKAHLKGSSTKTALAEALSNCVNTNDETGNTYDDDELINFVHRAKKVAEAWNKNVVPLLK